MQANDELLALGLRPMTWTEVVQAVREKLPPGDHERFLRLHRSFTGYLSPDTLERFYSFVFTRELHLEVNGYRFRRLEAVLDQLLPRIPPGRRILDIGAGAGLVAAVLLKRCRPDAYVAQDPCRGARDHLQSLGFAVLPHPAPAAPPGPPFDFLLCVDSLGEVHSDDDGALADPDREPAESLPQRIEERYGFAHKLEGWKPYLAKGGRVLLWEPIPYRKVWEAIGTGLGESGWKSRLHGNSPRYSYLELTLE